MHRSERPTALCTSLPATDPDGATRTIYLSRSSGHGGADERQRTKTDHCCRFDVSRVWPLASTALAGVKKPGTPWPDLSQVSAVSPVLPLSSWQLLEGCPSRWQPFFLLGR